MCSNGSHHFTTVKPYDPVEVGELNNAVNRLRSQLSDKDMQLSNAVQQANNLQKELADCRTQAANIETVVKTNRIPESIITFRQGKSVVDASQLPNVERVAIYMKNILKLKSSSKDMPLPKVTSLSMRNWQKHVLKL